MRSGAAEAPREAGERGREREGVVGELGREERKREARVEGRTLLEEGGKEGLGRAMREETGEEANGEDSGW